MKISIYPVNQKVADWVLALISFLEHDQEFENLILQIRDKLDISKIGLDIENWNEDFKLRFLNSEDPKTLEGLKVLSYGVQAIIDTYLLPTWWFYSLRILVVYNIFPIYSDTIVTEPSGGNTIKIRFNEGVSKTDFIEWVDKNWQVFEWSFPETRKSWKVRIKKNTLLLYEKIVQLKDIEGNTYSNIATILIKQLGEDADPEGKINEESVKQMYHRYKKYLQQFKSPR